MSIRREKSEALFEKAKTYFPGGVNSPVRAFRSVGGTPLFIERGKGSQIWHADGNEFIDFCASWGPLILGHANDKVIDAVKKAVEKGSSFGAPTALENDLADLILSNNKYIQKIRFVSSGTEAVMSAIRLARGYTKRNKILKFEGCYHGHSDSLLVKAGSGLLTFGNPSSGGVPADVAKHTLVLTYNDVAQLEKAFAEHGARIATVIVEPVAGNVNLIAPKPEFLQTMRELCTKHGAVLIFDEVMTGFRVG